MSSCVVFGASVVSQLPLDFGVNGRRGPTYTCNIDRGNVFIPIRNTARITVSVPRRKNAFGTEVLYAKVTK